MKAAVSIIMYYNLIFAVVWAVGMREVIGWHSFPGGYGKISWRTSRRLSSSATNIKMLLEKHEEIVSSNSIPSSSHTASRRAVVDSLRRLCYAASSAAAVSNLLQRPAYGSSSATSLKPSSFVAGLDCSDSMIVLEQPNTQRRVVLIGTAHISEESVKLVRRTIQLVHPDVVMIELDRKRIGKATDGKSLEEYGFIFPKDQSQIVVDSINSQDLPAQRQSIVSQAIGTIVNPIQQAAQAAAGALLGKALGQFYKSVEKLGFTAGGEFKAAVEEARAIGSKVLLGDRDVDFTLMRLASALSTVDNDQLLAVVDELTVTEKDLGLNLDDGASLDKVNSSYI